MTLPKSCALRVPGGKIRVKSEDFRVNEILSFEPDGAGEHLFVQIEKTDANTDWVANRLADFAEAGRREVSYAGRKDRHAVTRQWFCITLPGKADPDWSGFQAEGVTVLNCIRHSRKLRRGSIARNEFEIVVRDIDDPDEQLVPGLERIKAQGFPNFFGAQRFGHQNSNLDLASRWFTGEIRLRNNKRSLALSAARSAIFNDVLQRRLRDESWLKPGKGEALNPEGRGGFFLCDDPDEEIYRRVAMGELHLTGPLWGSGDPVVGAELADMEAGIAAENLALKSGLESSRLKHQRRALRAMPQNLQWQPERDQLNLEFSLGSGAYATSLLTAIMNPQTATPPASR